MRSGRNIECRKSEREMHEREFWQLVDEVFGHAYGRSLTKDEHIPQLKDMTAEEALAAGVRPRVVWNMLCDLMQVPDSQRWGHDHVAPPMPPKGQDYYND
jgi:hypothetical protein